MEEEFKKVYEALAEFIVRASKEGASVNAVQALPEAVKSFVELYKAIPLCRK